MPEQKSLETYWMHHTHTHTHTHTEFRKRFDIMWDVQGISE